MGSSQGGSTGDAGPAAAKAAAGVCHRIKNDLQTIAYILSLGSSQATSSRQLADSMEGRLVALSLGYTLVVETGQPPQLDHLAREVLRRNLWRGPAHLRTERRLPALGLSLRLCSPLSLWLYEIMGNALRHGLDKVSDPLLSIEGSLDQQGLVLTISDNGPGPPPGFDPQGQAGMGLKLAQALASTDLRGSLELTPAQPGLRATLRVPRAELELLTRETWW